MQIITISVLGTLHSSELSEWVVYHRIQHTVATNCTDTDNQTHNNEERIYKTENQHQDKQTDSSYEKTRKITKS